MGKNQCWKKSEQFLQVMQCISDRVSICRTYPCIQLPELGSLCFHVVKMTTEMKIISHPCITLKNWWSTFIHTSSLHHANPVRRKAEAPWFVQSDTERMSSVTQWRYSGPKASVLANMSQLFSVQIWRVLCNHKAFNSSKFPFQGPHDAAHPFLYLFWYVVFPS